MDVPAWLLDSGHYGHVESCNGLKNDLRVQFDGSVCY